MVNSQKWLDYNYPKEIRNDIIELRLFDKGLEEPLDFSDFVNLQELNLGFNPLTGSLKCLNLKKLENLNTLYIAFTNFDSGLEYLPANLKWIYCQFTNFDKEFVNYLDLWRGYYNYQSWRKGKISEIKEKIIELENSACREFCANTKKSSNISKVLINSIIEKQNKIDELKEQICEYYKTEIEFLPY